VVYTDRLDHRILLCKLREFGLSESLLQFFESYLGSRKQFVMCNGFRSKEITVSSGVPQGSVLGPLFFIMFINDISVNIESNILMYADDLKVYRKISNTHDCEMLQRDIIRIQEWCKCNNLFLNVQKCHAMSYTNKSTTILFDYHIDHCLLTRDNMICDLGITFDTRLTFSNHINVIVSGALRSLGFIIRCTKNFSDIRSLNMLYFAFVRSRLEYGSIIWSSNCQTHIQNLEKVQRRFLKFLAHRIDGTYPERGRSQSELLERFECQDLKTRRVNASMSFLRNLIHYRIDCSNLLSKLYFLVPRLTSRNHVCFYLPTPRIDVQKHSPLYTMCENYNVHQHAFDIFR
jgi:ribonuclease P/MRP protein subunit RPP40